MAPDLELPEVARHHLRRGGSLRQGGRRSDRQQFQIQVFAAGEIVPGLQAADAVPDGTVEMCHTASYYYFGKDPTFAFGTAVPFGLNSRMQTAWMLFGGGMELMNDFYKKFNIYRHPGRQYRRPDGRLVPQGDQERRRSQGPEDAHRRICRPRALPSSAWCRSRSPAATSIRRWRRARSMPPSGSAPTTTRSSASRRSRSTTTTRAGGKAGPMLHNFINLEKWNALPPAYKSLVRTASSMANEWMQAKYDAGNPAALKRLVAAGAQLRPFSQPVMDASLQGRARALRRDVEDQCRLQEGLRRRCSPSATTSICGGRSPSMSYDSS